jgi:hypothetical protein
MLATSHASDGSKGRHGVMGLPRRPAIVHPSTQVPHLIRAGLSEVMGIRRRSSRSRARRRRRFWLLPLQPEEVAIAWLTHFQKAVQVTEDRREHLVAAPTRASTED